MTFDNHAQYDAAMKAISLLDPEVLKQPLNPDFPAGAEEIAQLLTFLPENERLNMVLGFMEGMLVL